MIKWQGWSSSHDIQNDTKRTLSKIYYSVTGSPGGGNLTTFKYQNMGGKKNKGHSTIWCILDVHMIVTE
jgi:hypothetical protein